MFYWGLWLCYLVGYGFAIWWGSPTEEALYVGVALTATSIGISVQVLQQFGLIDKEVGRIVIAAAVIDDIVALYLLAMTHGALTETFMITQVARSMIVGALMFGLIFLVCRLLAKLLIEWLQSATLRLLFSLMIIVSFGWITHWLDYSLVVGGFIAGLGLGEGLQKTNRNALLQQYDSLVLILVPFFFVYIGSQANWQVLTDNGMMTLVGGLIVIALAGKILGGYIGAWSHGEIYQPFLIGVSMAPRGEVALVVASIGFEQGHISHHVLVALMLVVIASALLGAALMAPLARKLVQQNL